MTASRTRSSYDSSLHNWAYEYLDKGWSIIQISPANKKPLIGKLKE